MFMILHVNRHFLFNVYRDLDRVWLRDMHRDGIRLRYVYMVRDRDRYLNLHFHGVWNFLFYGEWNFLLNIYGIGLRNFNRIRLLNLDFDRNLHYVGDFLLYRDGVRLRDRILYFLRDDSGLHMVLVLDLIHRPIMVFQMLSQDASLHHTLTVSPRQRGGEEHQKTIDLRQTRRIHVFLNEAYTVIPREIYGLLLAGTNFMLVFIHCFEYCVQCKLQCLQFSRQSMVISNA